MASMRTVAANEPSMRQRREDLSATCRLLLVRQQALPRSEQGCCPGCRPTCDPVAVDYESAAELPASVQVTRCGARHSIVDRSGSQRPLCASKHSIQMTLSTFARCIHGLVEPRGIRPRCAPSNLHWLANSVCAH